MWFRNFFVKITCLVILMMALFVVDTFLRYTNMFSCLPLKDIEYKFNVFVSLQDIGLNPSLSTNINVTARYFGSCFCLSVSFPFHLLSRVAIVVVFSFVLCCLSISLIS